MAVTLLTPPTQHTASCGHCGATAAYDKLDVRTDYSTDYLGDRSYYGFIQCPACQQAIIVEHYATRPRHVYVRRR